MKRIAAPLPGPLDQALPGDSEGAAAWEPLADGFVFRPAADAVGGAAGPAGESGLGALASVLDGVSDGAARPPAGGAEDREDRAAAAPDLVHHLEPAALTAGPTAWTPSARPSAARVVEAYTSGEGGLGVESDFNIRIVFRGNWTEDLQEDFILAAEYLSTLITGDLTDVRGVDDVRIVATLSSIDGEGGVLGQAGPLAVRPQGQRPIAGVMEFDRADARDLDDEGLLDDTVIHEMLHCLGVGTLWDAMGLTTGSVAADTLRFTGLNARVAYGEAFPEVRAEDPRPGRGVPVETDGGPGTAGGHWDEVAFGAEIMTGYIDDDVAVSALTVAALEDMGYRTVFDILDPGRPIPQPDDFA